MIVGKNKRRSTRPNQARYCLESNKFALSPGRRPRIGWIIHKIKITILSVIASGELRDTVFEFLWIFRSKSRPAADGFE